VFTVDEMWSRPMRNALRYSWPRVRSGWAEFSSHTADTWVTVTSSSTPSDPTTMPASRMPRGSMGTLRASRNWVLSSV
jgi:hypothetical protein